MHRSRHREAPPRLRAGRPRRCRSAALAAVVPRPWRWCTLAARAGAFGTAEREFHPKPARTCVRYGTSRLSAREGALPADRAAAHDRRAGRALGASRSTIYYWVRDLPIARAGRANAGQRRGNRARPRKYRLLREAACQEGLDSFSELASEPTFRDFVCMYIAEGYMRNRSRVAICMDRAADTQAAVLLDPVPLRPGSGRPACILERGAWHRSRRKSNSGQLKGRQWRCPLTGCSAGRCTTPCFVLDLRAWTDCLKAEWVQESG